MKSKSQYNPFVPATEQTSRILIYLGQGDRFNKTLTDIVRDLGINKSKAYTILNTLIKFDFVQKDPYSKAYSLGPGLVGLSRYFLDNLNYPEIVAPFIKELATGTNGTTLFCIISGDHIFVIAKYEEYELIGLTIRLGHRLHITLGATGKAIVAFMPKDKRENIFTMKRLYFHGDPSRLDMERLINELEECRQKGYSIDEGEITPGITFISSPVFDSTNEVMGCLILVGTFRGVSLQSYGIKTASIAQQISLRLGANIETVYPNIMR